MSVYDNNVTLAEGQCEGHTPVWQDKALIRLEYFIQEWKTMAKINDLYIDKEEKATTAMNQAYHKTFLFCTKKMS